MGTVGYWPLLLPRGCELIVAKTRNRWRIWRWKTCDNNWIFSNWLRLKPTHFSLNFLLWQVLIKNLVSATFVVSWYWLLVILLIIARVFGGIWSPLNDDINLLDSLSFQIYVCHSYLHSLCCVLCSENCCCDVMYYSSAPCYSFCPLDKLFQSSPLWLPVTGFFTYRWVIFY